MPAVCCRFLEDTFADVGHLIRHSQPGSATGVLDAFQALGLSDLQQKIENNASASDKHNLRCVAGPHSTTVFATDAGPSG